ncbi:low choriolytic enzyme-like isoform X2 [Latimeria chalumnae]|uniref:Metalloendopeptidase n=1 Tax=Latimeria chalumnae TaxID=7897 RepID=M3XI20_LATCH|nr:PREDICTED: low choriolytic enzyme-like isoform X2 [Latimeria chalumnae]|eukprot:XP_005987015.1 PREDICTED: low choriolytic enzyme-like isoform X2 [Latimeria chalumnae]
MELPVLMFLVFSFLGASQSLPRKLLFSLELREEEIEVSNEIPEPTRGPENESYVEDPAAPIQIMKVNERLGGVVPEGPLLEFGDIAKDPLGNADRCTSSRCRWPKSRNGKVKVPYVLSNTYNSDQRTVIKRAMNEFSRYTCIKFRPRRNERDYLAIQSRSGCWSYIGRQGGQQIVSLQQYGCVYKGVVQHELIHALGFHHEQNRSDRDYYVTINYNNIIQGMEHNFRKVNTNNLGTTYDYYSVMHYGRYAFSKNRQPTIVPKPDPSVPIGQARTFDRVDIRKLNRLYKCSR